MTHDDITYQDVERAYAGAPASPTWVTDGDSFDVVAICPGCHGTTSKTVPRGLPLGNKSFWREDAVAPPQPPERVTMICGCGYPHPDRPTDSKDKGCGAVWKVPLE